MTADVGWRGQNQENSAVKSTSLPEEWHDGTMRERKALRRTLASLPCTCMDSGSFSWVTWPPVQRMGDTGVNGTPFTLLALPWLPLWWAAGLMLVQYWLAKLLHRMSSLKSYTALSLWSTSMLSQEEPHLPSKFPGGIFCPSLQAVPWQSLGPWASWSGMAGLRRWWDWKGEDMVRLWLGSRGHVSAA